MVLALMYGDTLLLFGVFQNMRLPSIIEEWHQF